MGRTFYVGLAASLHDPALAILDDTGTPLFAEGTERTLQRKRAYNAPPDDMLRIPELVHEFIPPDARIVAALSWSDRHLAWLDAVDRVAPGHPGRREGGNEQPGWPLPEPAALLRGARNALRQAALNLGSLREIPNPVTVRGYDHHHGHAANAVLGSPFGDCVVAVLDGYGEGRATSFYHWSGGRLREVRSEGRYRPASNRAPASLGSFYGTLCALCGFDPIKGEEWKVMGLAPYGGLDHRVYDLLRPLLEVDDLDLVAGCPAEEWERRIGLLRAERRPPGSSPLEAADLAFTGQAIFEEVATELFANLHRRGLAHDLAYAGGCALNSSYNGKITEETGFVRLHVPSAPADDGNALGAAYLAFAEDHPDEPLDRRHPSPYLGSSASADVLANLVRFGGSGRVEHLDGDLAAHVAGLLADGGIVGWFRGRAEFGPRALGNRSILADPRRAGMGDRINAEVKFREEFRPLAPSILAEHGPEWFEHFEPSPYMERTLRFRPDVRDRVPAVVHVDGTGRLQTVTRDLNPAFHDLLTAFHRLTGVPLLLNTSLNVMGRPLVHSVEDAVGMLFTTGLDALAVEDYLVQK